MKKITTLCLLLTLSLSTLTQKTDSFKEAFTEYLTLSNSKANFEVMVSQMLGMVKMQYGQLTDAQWKEVSQHFNDTFFAMITDDMLPLYKKHFTEAELKEVNAFFKSKAGKKYARSSVQVSQESMQFAPKWQGQAPAIVNDFIKEKGWQ